MLDIVVNGGWHMVAHLAFLIVVGIIATFLAEITKEEYGAEAPITTLMLLVRLVCTWGSAFWIWMIILWIVGISFIA